MALQIEQFRKDCVHRAKAPLPALLADLDQIEQFQRDTAAVRPKLRWAAGGILLAGIIMGILGDVFIMPIAAVLAVGLFVYSFVHGRRVLAHQDRLPVAREMIALLRYDSSERTPYSLVLGLAAREQQLSEQPFTARKNGKQMLLRDEWLALEGRLLDGACISSVITDLIRRRTFTNSNNKRKTKNRIRHLVDLQVAYPGETYGDARPLEAQAQRAIRLPASSTLKSVKVNGKALALKAVVTSRPDLQTTTAMLFVGAYRILHLSRRALR